MSNDELWATIEDPDMTPVERAFIVEASREAEGRAERRAAVIVHIGVGRGISLHCSRHGAPEALLYGVDVLGASVMAGDPQAAIITAFSQAAWLEFDEEIDLLFIDGDHSAAAVIGDVVGWRPLVRVGGLIVFHDYGNGGRAPWTAGVKQAVDALNWGGWEQVQAPGSLAALERIA